MHVATHRQRTGMGMPIRSASPQVELSEVCIQYSIFRPQAEQRVRKCLCWERRTMTGNRNKMSMFGSEADAKLRCFPILVMRVIARFHSGLFKFQPTSHHFGIGKHGEGTHRWLRGAVSYFLFMSLNLNFKPSPSSYIISAT